jgi:branched-chain amino acid transport system substrate-binding protein
MRVWWRQRRGPGVVAALALSAAVSLSGCSKTEPAEQRVRQARESSGDLVIAAAWPWNLRKEIRYGEGLQMAIDEVNARGGVNGRKLKLAKFDDQESIDQGRVIAHQIAEAPDVVAVVGHLQSYITVQTASVYDQAGLVMVAPTATDPELTEHGYGRVFRICFMDRSVGQQLADYASARGWKRVAIYYIRSNYGRNIANAFEARAAQVGLDIRARSAYDASEQASARTFDQTLRDWKSTELDAIVLAGEVPSAAIFVAEARKQGITVPILGGDAMSSPGLMAIAGKAAEGVIVASYFHPEEPRSEVAQFDKAFQAKYGFPPDAGSALGYDCVNLIAQAMLQAKSAAPDDVARAMHALHGLAGVTGPFTFDEHGDPVNKPVLLSIVRDGRFAYLPTPHAAGGTPTKAGAAP